MGHWWSIKSYKWTHHIKAIIPLTLLSLILLARISEAFGRCMIWTGDVINVALAQVNSC